MKQIIYVWLRRLFQGLARFFDQQAANCNTAILGGKIDEQFRKHARNFTGTGGRK